MHRHPVSGLARRLGAVAIALIAGLFLALPSLAQTAQLKDFDVPAQPLDSALKRVAEAQHLQILYDPAHVKGVATQGVKGKYTASEAVAKLVEGTGLVAVDNGGDAIAIKPKSANDKGGQAGNPTVLAQAQSAERQETPPSRDQKAVQLEGITVTARKREERFIDVPISISVVTKDEIERRGMVNAEDYLRGLPGANQVENVRGGTIIIRGLETAPFNQNFAVGPMVATYFGETPTTSTAGVSGATNIDIKLVDISRVEVLRGPQGTAFGNASMGGAVRTIPVAPNPHQYEGKVAVGYSSTSGDGGDNYNIQAVGNFPLAQERLAIRIVGYQFKDTGYIHNVAGSDVAFQTGVDAYGAKPFATDVDHVGSYEVAGGRIAALWQASEDFRFTVSYLSQKNETNGLAESAAKGTYQQTLLQVAPGHVVRGQTGGVADMHIDIANGTMEYSRGWANLFATYSYTRSGSTFSFPIYNNFWPVSQKSDPTHREQVGEIRFSTRLDGPLNVLVGLYAESLKDDTLFDNLWFGDPATNLFVRGQQSLGVRDDHRTVKQTAAFGEAYWELLPGLTLTGGVRSYDYSRTFRVVGTGFFYSGLNVNNNTNSSGAIYRANLGYKPNDTALIYAGWSQGFRLAQLYAGLPPGVCDPGGTGFIQGSDITIASTRQTSPDYVNNYELGIKIAPNRKVSIDTAAFHMVWSDLPVSIRPQSTAPGCSSSFLYTANAGKALSDGIEFQARVQVTEALRVDLSGSWVHARLATDVPAQGFHSGDPLPGSPKVNASLALLYDFNVAGKPAFVRADSIYVGPFYGAVVRSPDIKAGDYVKLDLTAGLAIRNDLRADLFVRNVTNQDAFAYRNIGLGTGASAYGYPLRPRTIGFQVGYSF